MSYYCHSTPGRLRIKTPVIWRNPAEIAKAHRLLQSLPGVDAFDINPVTGSITINYTDWETGPEPILDALREKGYFKAPQNEEPDNRVETVVSKAGTAVGKAILGACVEKVFESSMLSFLALLV
jgi:copper chaperone CopZ